MRKDQTCGNVYRFYWIMKEKIPKVWCKDIYSKVVTALTHSFSCIFEHLLESISSPNHGGFTEVNQAGMAFSYCKGILLVDADISTKQVVDQTVKPY